MNCRAMPYEGEEPFVFFSYCHKDAERVYPLLEKMAGDGIRVWYDDGNHAGDEWPQNIAQHLDKCRVFLAMLSGEAEKSHNCKKEINFAIQSSKKSLVVMLEKFEMTLGMRLQLGDIYHLNRYDYPSDNALLDKLYESDCLSECRGKESLLKPEKLTSKSQKGLPEPIDGEFIEIFGADGTIISNRGGEITIYDPHTENAEQVDEAALIRLNTREIHFITSSMTTLGNAKDNDFQIENKLVSRHHATVLFHKGSFYLKDEGSTNGTFIGKSKLDAKQPKELSNMSIFSLWDEPFMLIFGEEATALKEAKSVAFLINRDTQCVRPIGKSGLSLGRNHKWSDGTFGNGKVSRNHAVIRFDNNEFVIEDISTNGTYLDGKKLTKGNPTVLRDGTQIGIVDHVLEFVLISV